MMSHHHGHHNSGQSGWHRQMSIIIITITIMIIIIITSIMMTIIITTIIIMVMILQVGQEDTGRWSSPLPSWSSSSIGPVYSLTTCISHCIPYLFLTFCFWHVYFQHAKHLINTLSYSAVAQSHSRFLNINGRLLTTRIFSLISVTGWFWTQVSSGPS